MRGVFIWLLDESGAKMLHAAERPKLSDRRDKRRWGAKSALQNLNGGTDGAHGGSLERSG